MTIIDVILLVTALAAVLLGAFGVFRRLARALLGAAVGLCLVAVLAGVSLTWIEASRPGWVGAWGLDHSPISVTLIEQTRRWADRLGATAILPSDQDSTHAGQTAHDPWRPEHDYDRTRN